MGKVDQEVLDQYLTNYLRAEKLLAETLAGMQEFAPTEGAKASLQSWATDAAAHHAIWERLAKGKTFEPGRLDLNTWKVFEIAEGYVRQRNWMGSVTGAALIEHLLNAAAVYLYRHADGQTQAVLRRVAGDYLGHLDFANQEIARADSAGYEGEGIRDVQERYFLEFLDWPVRQETTEADMDILNDAYHLHRIMMKRLGVRMPKIYFSRDFHFEIKRSLMKRGMPV